MWSLLTSVWANRRENIYFVSCQFKRQWCEQGTIKTPICVPFSIKGIYWLAIKKENPWISPSSCSFGRTLSFSSRNQIGSVFPFRLRTPRRVVSSVRGAARSRSNANSACGGLALHLLLSLLLHAHIRTNCRVVCQTLLVRLSSSGVCLLKGGNPPVIKGVAEAGLRFDWGKQISHPSPKRKQWPNKCNCRIVNVRLAEELRVILPLDSLKINFFSQIYFWKAWQINNVHLKNSR